ncbi:thioredoxin domain-containing protein [Rubricoccus marinus]|uniref:Spermatogenesis-associated protein 20-like TRX domain-containing protein n=1 Tax=Rubricoccus marinus TaxID=716817 RepID=A0A259TX51_9BACT|nr:thioredoxin domain-containing protein [Rubricoccus marinus]OZC02128.1 hypothetical protein BSZ36_03485 [Rubricoccus marinus]
MTPEHTNRLASEKSPYLLQHAHNPVDWWPWGDEAFAEADARGVPVFLSVGYATCHWCHVMEEESFEDAEAAAALNRAFVCVKVDREERPDVDGVYMAAALALNGHGGWPLTALLVPHTREPFYVGTYLPKESRGGRIGVIDLAERVTGLWRDDRANVLASAGKVGGIISTILAENEPGDAITQDDLTRAVGLLGRSFDPANGGFGAQPKFPTPHNLLFLLREGRRTGNAEATRMAHRTLQAIARGGITDHAGGGVHRYSTDRRWLLPHFEKMLYDQAGLALAWTEAWQASGDRDETRDDEMKRAAEATLDYVLCDLRLASGAFASAEDADSLDARGKREEGAFYVWTETELADILGAETLEFAREAFGTYPEGNFLDEATRVRTGGIVLHLPEPEAPLAERLGMTPEAFRLRRRDLLDRLLDARASRPRPLLDDKVLADWNGLAIAALAVAARVFDRSDYAEAASRAADFVLREMRTPEAGLLHRWREGEAAVDGFLDDYAFMAWGLLELYQTTFDAARLQTALDLHRQTRERFEDASGGYFLTEAGTPGLLVRQKALDDGALPSGNAVAAMNGIRLAQLTGDRETENAALAALSADARIRAHPTGHTFHLLAAQLALGPAPEVVLAVDEASGGEEMTRAIRGVYAPGALLLKRSEPLAEIAPFTAEQTARDGLATAYVCERGACQAPTTSAPEAARTLDALHGG